MTFAASNGLVDVERFHAELDALQTRGRGAFAGWLGAEGPVTIARAPGRLDVMGGIADYSGSLVLEMPLAEAALVAVQPNAGGVVRIASLGDVPERDRMVVLSAEEVWTHSASYDEARALFAGAPERAWAAYVAGTLSALILEARIEPARGVDVVLASSVPEGKGVSSSAAIEVATMKALAAAFDVVVDPVELAVWCQRVENRIVGAPCGIMDQMTSASGCENQLLELECQPARILGNLAIGRDVAFWGIDSGVRHAVSGSDYGRVRVGAFMGHRILCQLRGLDARNVGEGRVAVDDPVWRGYLANVPPSEFEARWASALPVSMSGSEFLRQFGGTVDPATRVDPDTTYAVRAPTAHPVWEHHRVRTFAELLPSAASERVRELLGELMLQSHASYGACGLGSDATDLLVELARAYGPAAGLYGAKISGGGSGGTVVVLGRADAGGAVRTVVREYAERTGRTPIVFSGSSPGAAAFGTHTRPRSR